MLNWFAETIHVCWVGPTYHYTQLTHCWGTVVSWSALLSSDLTSVTSTDSSYSLIRSTSVLSHLHSSILRAALVINHAFSIRAFEIHQWTQAESVIRCSTFTCHWSAKLTLFNNASSSALLMCYVLFARHNQHTYSITDLSASIVTLVAREFVFTQAVNSYLFTHQLLLTGSRHCTLASICTGMLLRGHHSFHHPSQL